MERLNLGELIDLLEKQLKKQHEDNIVVFDFGDLSPTKCISYHGYYEDLAIEFDQETSPKVEEFLTELQSAVGKTFEGYKGGNYRMTRKSRVWVANYKHCSGTVITGIEDCNYQTILRTKWVDE